MLIALLNSTNQMVEISKLFALNCEVFKSKVGVL